MGCGVWMTVSGDSLEGDSDGCDTKLLLLAATALCYHGRVSLREIRYHVQCRVDEEATYSCQRKRIVKANDRVCGGSAARAAMHSAGGGEVSPVPAGSNVAGAVWRVFLAASSGASVP